VNEADKPYWADGGTARDGCLPDLPGRGVLSPLIYRSDDNDWPRTPGPVFEYGWNHTTLRALKVDPAITYLQVRYCFPDHLEKIEAIRAQFPDGEVLQHLELLRRKR
jgi:hypothetical protein